MLNLMNLVLHRLSLILAFFGKLAQGQDAIQEEQQDQRKILAEILKQQRLLGGKQDLLGVKQDQLGMQIAAQQEILQAIADSVVPPPVGSIRTQHIIFGLPQ